MRDDDDDDTLLSRDEEYSPVLDLSVLEEAEVVPSHGYLS
jgi:hypothetical protein